MTLSIQHLVPGKRYAFTATVNQKGTAKKTDTPTRALYDVRTGDVHDEHTWITYEEDVKRFNYRAFGDTVEFTAETYIYDGNKVGIRNIEQLKYTGRAGIDKILEMCAAKDKGKSATRHRAYKCAWAGCTHKDIGVNVRMYFGFSTKGTEMYFDCPECRAAYMNQVFA